MEHSQMFIMEKVREKRFRIICSYTNREWGQISAALKEREIINHIISEVKNLEPVLLDIESVSEDDKTVKAKQFYPPPGTARIIKELSDKLGILPSVLVSRLILTPLLKK